MDPLRMGGGGLDGRGQDRSVGLEDEIDMVVRQVFGSLDATNVLLFFAVCVPPPVDIMCV